MREVELVDVVVDLDDVASFRANLISARSQAAKSSPLPRLLSRSGGKALVVRQGFN